MLQQSVLDFGGETYGVLVVFWQIKPSKRNQSKTGSTQNIFIVGIVGSRKTTGRPSRSDVPGWEALGEASGHRITSTKRCAVGRSINREVKWQYGNGERGTHGTMNMDMTLR